MLDTDRLFPLEPKARDLARALYREVSRLPIISPHGHTDPRWYAENEPFPDPAQLFVVPDHYVFRMLCSQGIPPEKLGVARIDGGTSETDSRAIWRLFAENFYLFRGTPSRGWLEHAFEHVFGLTKRLGPDTADEFYDHIDDCLKRPEFRPRALFERFNIEVIATTEDPLDDLKWHRQIRESGWTGGRVITAYRPDPVVDPDFEGFAENVEKLGAITGLDTTNYDQYLDAHRMRRAYFRKFGATSTDHGHATARTEDLPKAEATALFEKALKGACSADEADAFRGHMLTEMARMSIEDGLVLQIHPGSFRNHSSTMMARHGRNVGFDIPVQTSYVEALRPLLNAVGMDPALSIILFTLDETVYTRELAPLAGAYPSLKLGPAWWFHDSPEGMRRYREMTTETAGFYNTVGFNDDTRAFCSIPARHDVARRVDCAYLATLVTTGRLDEDEAPEVARDLTYNLVKRAYRL
ncbi:glucuronate isomerase [Martelella mediterranea]|uniref:Uronate isomerase n=1 Tax=Martelella mediterranea DSM 17316 TaxID=1122214 RepID=A0A1U9YZ96_9HYPH|nr:glucuronate isomerase [Martelella mediterranea]AQZ50773.1 Uronate isomerase [Martelella mediterranea DSM 17316]